MIIQERKVAKEGSIVRLYDTIVGKEECFEIVSQSRKVHYLEHFYYQGRYVQKTEFILDHGGDGESTISTNSPLGKVLLRKSEGDFCIYESPDGNIQKFEIIEIINIDGDDTDNGENDHIDNHSDNTVSVLVCPYCKSKLVRRVSRNTKNVGHEFYGCSRFPKCTYTRNLN